MSEAPTDFLSPEALAAVAWQAPRGPGCAACASLRCPGWETLPADFDERRLRHVGTLRAGDDEPTFAEFHPAGTRLWSADAPIAPHHHPYNRSTVKACAACGRTFLRYTEFGGYYVDHRIRELDPALLAAADEDAAG